MSGRILGKIGLAVLVIALVDLGFLNWWVVKNDKLATNIQYALSVRQSSASAEKQAAENQISLSSSPEPSPTPVAITNTKANSTSTSQTTTVVQNAQKEIFIPLGTGSTKSNSYAELAGLEVTIDPSKYSAIESIVFQASIWTDGGNGRAWGELYVVDDKNPLIESQISNPTGTSTLKTSGNIPIPGGAKTYRVWAKTDLTDYAAHIDNSRIKITLK